MKKDCFCFMYILIDLYYAFEYINKPKLASENTTTHFTINVGNRWHWRDNAQYDLHFFGTILFVPQKLMRLLMSDLSTNLVSLGRKKVTQTNFFQVSGTFFDHRTVPVYQNNPKCDPSNIGAVQCTKVNKFTRIWPFWGLLGQNLP